MIVPEDLLEKLYDFCNYLTKGNFSQANELLRNNRIKMNINTQLDKGRTLLHSSILDDREDIVEYLCSKPSIKPNIEDKWGERAISRAIDKKYSNTVHFLLSLPDICIKIGCNSSFKC